MQSDEVYRGSDNGAAYDSSINMGHQDSEQKFAMFE